HPYAKMYFEKGLRIAGIRLISALTGIKSSEKPDKCENFSEKYQSALDDFEKKISLTPSDSFLNFRREGLINADADLDLMRKYLWGFYEIEFKRHLLETWSIICDGGVEQLLPIQQVPKSEEG